MAFFVFSCSAFSNGGKEHKARGHDSALQEDPLLSHTSNPIHSCTSSRFEEIRFSTVTPAEMLFQDLTAAVINFGYAFLILILLCSLLP